MLSIVLLGTGNVASHLFRAFKKSEQATILQVVGRTKEKLTPFEQECRITTQYKNIVDADVYLIVVADDVIEEVSRNLNDKQGLVAHTSGSTSIKSIVPKRKGVFYPLQTFSKDRKIDFKKVPICIEASSSEDLKVLEKLAHELSDSVQKINSEQRKKLHLAAVFINNFTNHFYHIGSKICTDEHISFDILKPLINETAEKIKDLTPSEAQTGPAKRNDIRAMQGHLDLLESPVLKKIYQLVSESIRRTHEEEL